MIKSRRCVRKESGKRGEGVYIIDLVAWWTSTEQVRNRYRISTVLRTDRFGWRCRVLPVLIVEPANQDFPCRAWKIAIGSARGGERDWHLCGGNWWSRGHGYCRHIAADCGGKRQIVVEGVTGCVPWQVPTKRDIKG